MSLPVVVVGAGPTGVAAATLLASYGVEVIVLDRWSDVYAQPRAVHLDDETYRILGRLGVAEEFAAISRPSQGLRLQDPSHRVLAVFERPTGTGRHGYPQANMFDQPELESLLRRNLQRQAKVTFRGDVEVTGVHQDNSLVRVDLNDKSTGTSETLLASYALGCDGANSVVRASIGSRLQDLRFEQRWLVVDVNTEADLGQWEGVHQVCDTHRAATYMRIGERRYRWEFQLADGETHEQYADLANLRPLIEPWVGGVPDAALEIVRVAEYTFRAQLADRWRDRRVFLLGDAAHLTPPFIGQGMGAGLRDAHNLAWKLAGVLDRSLPETVLDTYEQERRPHARHLIRLAIFVGTAMTRGGRVGDVLRRWIAPRAHLVPGLRDKVLDSATQRLQRGQLVRGRGLAGTLCPNADGFDERAAGRFALVTTRPVETDALVVRPGETLHDWLTGAGVEAALVRPDGYVLASGSAERLATGPVVASRSPSAWPARVRRPGRAGSTSALPDRSR